MFNTLYKLETNTRTEYSVARKCFGEVNVENL